MRDKYFDNAKGILIIFIVLAHIFSACADYYGYDDDFFKFCSLFMIPCFFFISAYFSSKSHQKRGRRIFKMVCLYVFWQILVTIYYSFVLKTMNFSLNILYPRYTYWFLVSLISYLLLEYLFERLSYKVMIPLGFLLALLSGFVSSIGEFGALARTFTFLPFYVLGFYANDLGLIEKIKSMEYKKICIVLSLLILVFLLIYDDILPYKLLRGKYSYYDISGSLVSVFLKRIIFYVFSLIVSLSFFKVMTSKETVFTRLGQNTLNIYLLQGAILKTIVTYEMLPSNIVLGNLVMLLVLVICIYILDKLVKKVKEFFEERTDNLWIRNLQVLNGH